MAEDSRRLRTAGLSRLTHQEMVCCLAFILLYALVANVPFALASRAGDFVPWGDELPCSAVGRVSADPSVCSWAQIIARVHRSMATVAMQNHPRQTIFVLVGDHAPPFGEPALRSLFAPGVVPYVVLIPR